MTDKRVDVGGRRRPATPTSAADIVGHQADVGRRHFFSSSPTLTPTSSADVGLSVGECRPPTLSVQFSDTHTDVGGRHSPTLADTQADTQSITLVLASTGRSRGITLLYYCTLYLSVM